MIDRKLKQINNMRRGLSKAMAEVGVADGGGGVLYCVAEGFFFSYEDAEATGTAYTGV